jgi:hypothetical protein
MRGAIPPDKANDGVRDFIEPSSASHRRSLSIDFAMASAIESIFTVIGHVESGAKLEPTRLQVSCS